MKDRYECSCGKLYATLMQVKCKCNSLYDHKYKKEIYKGLTCHIHLSHNDGTRKKS